MTLLIASSLLQSALAFAPPQEVVLGQEPTRIQHVHPQVQAELRGQPSWQGFLKAEGAGWMARFDQQTGLPLRAWGPGIDIGATFSPAQVEAGLRDLIAAHPALFGVDVSDLVLEKAEYIDRMDAWYVTFGQTVEGVPVRRGRVEARIKAGKLVMLGMETYPDASTLVISPDLSADEAIAEALDQGPYPDALHRIQGARLVILPLEMETGLTLTLTYEVRSQTMSPRGDWVMYVDASTGRLLNFYNEVRFVDGTISAVHDLRTVDGLTATSPVPLMTVNTTGSSTNTDELGQFTLDGESFSAKMAGSWLTVDNRQGSDATATFTQDLTWQSGASGQTVDIAEIDSYIFLHHVLDWAKQYAPEVRISSDKLTSNVNLNSNCNAYYDGNVNFYRSGSGCNNTARIADVNYHEWGHGFHYYSAGTGYLDGSVGEGAGDIAAFLQTDDFIIAPYFSTGGSGIRDVAEDRVYPDDIVNQVHTDGLIFGGAMWDLWAELEKTYGRDGAQEVLSGLYAGALKGNPSIPTTYDEVIFADDDDGDLGNGTPNTCAIVAAFSVHGLGPLDGAGLLSLSHTPLVNQLNPLSIPITAELFNSAPDCNDGNLTGGELTFATDWVWGGTPTWNTLSLSADSAGLSGVFPALTWGDVVHYYMEAASSEGDILKAPAGGFINPHSFVVGELVPLYFNDFEADDGGYTSELVEGQDTEGANDWQWGRPNAASTDPDGAYSGRRAWGNDLGNENYNGEYQNEKHNRLTSVPIDVTAAAGADLYIQFRRWLGIEDGYFDTAYVTVDGVEVWNNHQSSGGDRDPHEEHHIDDTWALHTIVVADSDGDGFITIAWGLVSDGGLAYGGWNIDDVGVYTLAPEPVVEEPEDTADTADSDSDTTDTDGDTDGGVTDSGLGEDSIKLEGDCGCASTNRSPTPTHIFAFAALAGLIGLRRRSR